MKHQPVVPVLYVGRFSFDDQAGRMAADHAIARNRYQLTYGVWIFEWFAMIILRDPGHADDGKRDPGFPVVIVRAKPSRQYATQVV